MSQNWWFISTVNLKAVLLGCGASCAGGCAGVGGCICSLCTGDLQLATSWQNPEPLVWFELRTWNRSTHETQMGMVFKYITHKVFSTSWFLRYHVWYGLFPLLMLSLCLTRTHSHKDLPSFLQVRLGGGMPLDSHTREMRLPSVTVRVDTSSEPRILG